MSLQGAIREYLSTVRKATISQVVAAVGRLVTASQAMRCYERDKRVKTKGARSHGIRKANLTPVEVGRRRAITSTLGNMVKCGMADRVSIGVYKGKKWKRK